LRAGADTSGSGAFPRASFRASVAIAANDETDIAMRCTFASSL